MFTIWNHMLRTASRRMHPEESAYEREQYLRPEEIKRRHDAEIEMRRQLSRRMFL